MLPVKVASVAYGSVEEVGYPLLRLEEVESVPQVKTPSLPEDEALHCIVIDGFLVVDTSTPTQEEGDAGIAPCRTPFLLDVGHFESPCK